jgi:Acetyltransferase (GNAT) domain
VSIGFDETPFSGYYVSADKKLLDEEFVIREITGSYWGGWRSKQTILKSIDNSLCFGLYERTPPNHEDFPVKKDPQVGFARVVTDYATFAWICDVVISRYAQGKKLGTFLMSCVMKHPEVKPRACLLTTRDAHELYAKFGFVRFEAMKYVPPGE